MRAVAFKITSFPTIIVCRAKAVGFKIISLTAAIIKLRSFLKKTIGVHITSRQIKVVF